MYIYIHIYIYIGIIRVTYHFKEVISPVSQQPCCFQSHCAAAADDRSASNLRQDDFASGIQLSPKGLRTSGISNHKVD